VLGLVAALHDNGKGGAGLAPDAEAMVASGWVADPDGLGLEFSVAAAIHQAAGRLRAGDVLLIEAQVRPPAAAPADGGPPPLLPVEVEAATFEAISTATSRGIVVIEAGGNGDYFLNQWKSPTTGVAAFMPAPPAELPDLAHLFNEDSGAVLVGAGTAGLPLYDGDPGGVHRRATWGDVSVRYLGHDFVEAEGSNYGARVDCYAWGEQIATCGGDGAGRGDYTSAFGGTSGASAIIAGAAALVNGLLRARGRAPLGAYEMRDLLRNGPGTATGAPTEDQIQRMPDLRGIVRERLCLAPSLALGRGAFAGLSLVPAGEAPAEADEGHAPLRALPGAAHDLYVHVANTSAFVAADVRVCAWCVPLEGAPAFERWLPVVSTVVVDTGLGPDAPLLVGPIEWPAKAQPEPGGYALVVGAWPADEPGPNVRGVRSARDLAALLEREPGLAVRRLAVGHGPHTDVLPAGPGHVRLRFFAFGEAATERMSVRIAPEGDDPNLEAWLEVPEGFPIDLLGEIEPEPRPPADVPVEGRLYRLPPQSPRVLLSGVFPARWSAPLYLVVDAARAPRLALELVRDDGAVVRRLAWPVN
jgi:hypothetical protein